MVVWDDLWRARQVRPVPVRKAHTMHREQPSVLGLVFLTVMLDMMGFSVIFPLFPAMLEHYVGLEGHASLIGRLVRILSWSSPDTFTVVVLFGGVLGSIYSLHVICVRSDLGDFVRPSGAPSHCWSHCSAPGCLTFSGSCRARLHCLSLLVWWAG